MFYTSYASSADDRGPVQRFHFDVQSEIYRLLGHHRRHEGRLQRATPSNGPDQAVLTCRSLLVLYSAGYLTDRQCALEWSVFRSRMERREWLTGEARDALVGVLWRTDALVVPRAVADTGQLLDDIGDGYQGPGVAGLQGDRAARQSYNALVHRVAERLTRAARVPLPAMSEDDSTTVTPCFGPEDKQSAVAAGQPSAGERHVVLVLMVSTREDMERLRESTACYAENAEEWRPFWPHSDEPAADIAGWAARASGVDRLSVVTVAGTDTQSLRSLPEIARSAAVLVLVDPWLTEDPSFPVHWEQLARSGTRIASVITVLPRHDRETRHAAGRLREALARTPARRLGAAHHEAGTPEALSHAVAAVMADVRTDAEERGRTPDRADEPPVGTTTERLARTQREWAGRLRRRDPWPPLLARTPRESWGGG
ncbi:hypothetical protein ACFV29_12025 [Streptomyces sp. NPDC059690]|uniref:hypothetical protein n=1 Tax=Streptomyces sp. NPDC059690 TaxID=3346907 RepID=UPI0036CDBBA3